MFRHVVKHEYLVEPLVVLLECIVVPLERFIEIGFVGSGPRLAGVGFLPDAVVFYIYIIVDLVSLSLSVQAWFAGRGK
jgi:hypothetical protein